MRVLLIDEFSRIGGGQILAKLLLDYFNKIGDETWVEVDRGHKYIDYKNIIITPYVYRENMFMPLLYYHIIKTKKFLNEYNNNNKNKFNLTINNHPNMFIYKADVNYLHGFSFLDSIIDEYGEIKNKIIFEFIKKIGIYNIYNNANFLVNSKYTLELSKKLFPKLGIKPGIEQVIYHPVRSDIHVDASSKDKKLVLSIGRIDIRKNYTQLLEIAKSLKDYRFIIAGALNDGDEDYYKTIVRNKSSNVEILININEDKKIELLKKASIYLHLNRRENYGVSVLEAMSYGLIPVVPRSGGPWIDIVSGGEYGYGFDTIDEAVENIKSIDYNMVQRIIHSMERFSYSNFYEAIHDVRSKIDNSQT